MANNDNVELLSDKLSNNFKFNENANVTGKREKR